MDIEIKNYDQVCAIKPKDQIDTSSAPQFEQAIVGAIDAGTKQLVLNFECVKYVASSGLRAMLVARKKLQAVSGKLVICTVSSDIMKVFEISGVSSMFTIVDKLDEALIAAKAT